MGDCGAGLRVVGETLGKVTWHVSSTNWHLEFLAHVAAHCVGVCVRQIYTREVKNERACKY